MTEIAQWLLVTLGEVGLAILLFFVLILIIIGFFNEKVNSFFCIVLGVMATIILTNICISSDSVDVKSFEIGLIVGIWFAIRCLPCLSIEREKNTYLILGTLVEESDSRLVGFGTLAGVSAVFGLIAYFISNWALNNNVTFIGIVIGVILCIYSLISFIKSFFD